MESQIKQNVMRRVHTMHLLRPLVSTTALAGVVMIVSVYELGRLVFVAQVFRNMPAVQDISALLQFFVSAYLNTDVAVQLFTLLAIFGVAWMVRDIARMVQVPRVARG